MLFYFIYFLKRKENKTCITPYLKKIKNKIK